MSQGAASDARRIVLFDFDGVLIRGDTFGRFVRERYARAWWRKGLVLLLSPLLLLLLPFSRWLVVRWLVRIALLGIRERRYRKLAGDFAQELVQHHRPFLRDGMNMLRQHQASGDRVVIVTGCEETLVRGVLAEVGLAELEVLASCLRPGWLGVRPAWHNIGANKVAALAQHGIETWQVAYGDSIHDLQMLAGATAPVLVNANPKLCKRVEKALDRNVARIEWY